MKNSFFLIIFLLSNSLFSQNIPQSQLEEIVVSATKNETPLIEIASSIDIIDSEQILALKKNSVLEILRDVKGISLTQPGGMGKVSSVFMRGANSNHTLILIDGFEVNDPSSPGNAFDFTALNVNNIERIEIIRGPQSTLFGSDAMSGVINIITKAPTEKQRITLNGEYGSNNFKKIGGSVSGSANAVSYLLNANFIDTEGISAASEKYGNEEKDGFFNYAIDSKLRYQFSDDFALTGFFKYNFAETDLDKTSQFGDDPNYTYDLEESLFYLTADRQFLDGAINSKLSVSLLNRISHAIDEKDAANAADESYQFNKAKRVKADFQNTIKLGDRNKLSAIVEYENEIAETEFRSDGLFGEYQSIFPESEMNTFSISLLDQFDINNTFFASAGIRLDKNNQFGTNFTYKIAPAFYYSDINTKFRFTLGSGIKSPSLFNLFDPLFGNPDLNPEKSLGWDTGVDMFLSENISIGLTYFSTEYNDLIDFDANFKPVNIAEASTKGIEAEIKLNNFYNFILNVNYTYLTAIDENTPDEEADLIRRPDNKINLSITYLGIENAYLNLTYKLVGRRYDRDFSTFPASRIELPQYSLLNFVCNYEINPSIGLYFRLDNALDEYYEDALYFGSYGRTFYTGVD